MSATRLVIVSVVLAGGLVSGLRGGADSAPPLSLSVAASLRPVAEAVAADFTQRTGRRVEIRSGGSEQLLMQLGHEPCDLFLPADDDYVRQAHARHLVGESRPLARMHAVAVASSPLSWREIARPGTRVALARPETAAIGRKTRQVLTASGHWSELTRVVSASPDTVTACMTAVRLGAADASVVWDVVARGQPGLVVSEMPELAGVTSEVSIAPCLSCADPAAARELIEFFAGEGKPHFARAGFDPP